MIRVLVIDDNAIFRQGMRQLVDSIDGLEGSVPDSTGACTLFIDPLGRPLSPVSVAGMHRRL